MHIKDKITCFYSPLAIFGEKIAQDVLCNAGSVTKLMGFPLGEGKANLSMAKESWCKDSIPSSKGREQWNHCQSSPLPYEGSLEVFSRS